jgi:hypothetical protein
MTAMSHRAASQRCQNQFARAVRPMQLIRLRIRFTPLLVLITAMLLSASHARSQPAPRDARACPLEAPAGVAELDLEFDRLSPVARTCAPRRDGPGQAEPAIGMRCCAAPGGFDDSRTGVKPSLRLTEGWTFGTALNVASHTGPVTALKLMSVATLIDPLVYAGRHMTRIDFGPEAAAPGRTSVSLTLLPHGSENFAWLLGFSVGKEGQLPGARWDSPALQTGLSAAAQRIAIDGSSGTTECLKIAPTAAKASRSPNQLLVKGGDPYRTVSIAFGAGPRCPKLARIKGIKGIEGGEDRLRLVRSVKPCEPHHPRLRCRRSGSGLS